MPDEIACPAELAPSQRLDYRDAKAPKTPAPKTPAPKTPVNAADERDELPYSDEAPSREHLQALLDEMYQVTENLTAMAETLRALGLLTSAVAIDDAVSEVEFAADDLVMELTNSASLQDDE